MLRMFSALLFCLLSMSAYGTQGQNTEFSANANISGGERQGNEMSDGLIFLQTLERLGRCCSTSNATTEMVQTDMHLNEDEAKDFVYLMQNTGRFVRAETDGVEQRIACESGSPRVGGKDFYKLTDEIFDEMIRISTLNLQLLKKDIGPEKAASLQQWLDRQKLNNSETKVNYRDVFERAGIDPDEALARLWGTDKNSE